MGKEYQIRVKLRAARVEDFARNVDGKMVRNMNMPFFIENMSGKLESYRMNADWEADYIRSLVKEGKAFVIATESLTEDVVTIEDEKGQDNP